MKYNNWPARIGVGPPVFIWGPLLFSTKIKYCNTIPVIYVYWRSNILCEPQFMTCKVFYCSLTCFKGD